MRLFSANSLAALALVGITIPTQAFAGEQTIKSAASVADIVLSASGELHGQVVQSSGRPVKNAVVQVSHKGSIIAEVKTDAEGRYAVKGVRTGLHTVKSSKSRQLCRFWTKHTAPAAARKSLVMSADSQVVRGQMLGGDLGPLLGAAVVGGTAATVVFTTIGQGTFDLGGGAPPASP